MVGVWGARAPRAVNDEACHPRVASPAVFAAQCQAPPPKYLVTARRPPACPLSQLHAARQAHLRRDLWRQPADKHVAKAVGPRHGVVVQVQRGGDVAWHNVVGKHIELVVALLVPVGKEGGGGVGGGGWGGGLGATRVGLAMQKCNTRARQQLELCLQGPALGLVREAMPPTAHQPGTRRTSAPGFLPAAACYNSPPPHPPCVPPSPHRRKNIDSWPSPA